MPVPHRWRDLSSFEKTSEIWLNWPWAAGQPRCPVLNTGRAARNLQRSSGGTVSNLILLQQSFYISESHNMPELRIVAGLSQPPDMVTDGSSSSSSSTCSSSSSGRSRSRSRSSSTTTPTPITATAPATATATVMGFKSWMNGHAGFLNVPGMDVYHLVGALFLESGWHVTIGVHKAPRKLWVCFPWMPLAGFAWHFSAKVVCRHTEWLWLWLWSHEFFMTWSIVRSCDRCMTKAATATRKTRTTNRMTNRNRMDKKERKGKYRRKRRKEKHFHEFTQFLSLATACNTDLSYQMKSY